MRDDAVASLGLGAIEREVGITQQILRRGHHVGSDRDADAHVRSSASDQPGISGFADARHGTDGSIASYDYDDHVTLQTRKDTSHRSIPVDVLPAGRRGIIEYVVERMRDGRPVEPPLDPDTCLIGQRMIDSAVLSSQAKRTVALVP